MGMNIKNDETHRLAQELAALTGESLTAAVTEALREKLARLRHERDREARLKRLRKIAKEAAALWVEPYKSMDHADMLYDELGLPK
jgi:antitoxin VapB